MGLPPRHRGPAWAEGEVSEANIFGRWVDAAQSRLESTMSISRDLEEFVQAHRPHEPLTSYIGEATPTGYRLAVAWPLRRDLRAVGAAPGCRG